MEVSVRDNDDCAARTEEEMQREVFSGNEMRRSYEKPSERRARERPKTFEEPATGTIAAGTRRLLSPRLERISKAAFRGLFLVRKFKIVFSDASLGQTPS